VAAWNAATPNAFTESTAKSSVSNLATSPDGNVFAVRSRSITEIRGSDLTLSATPTAAELENIPGRTAVPGSALHPSGALLYEPCLDGPAPELPSATGIRGGIDIRDDSWQRLSVGNDGHSWRKASKSNLQRSEHADTRNSASTCGAATTGD
jgi:hypothetical protein